MAQNPKSETRNPKQGQNVALQPSEVPALQSEVAPTDLASVEPRTGN